jgi:MFS transporter, MCT family, solute carrier family 16 (monocarboxylic acid transporters), member 10
VVSTWFKEVKSFAVGIVASGASVGGVVYSLMIRYLADRMGLVNAQLIVATLATITTGLTILTARPKPVSKDDNIAKIPPSPLKLSTYWDSEAVRDPSFCSYTMSIAFLFLGFVSCPHIVGKAVV